MVGRESERGRITRLLDRVRAGLSDAVVVRGAPGMGKTMLLEWALAQAGDLPVLRARGLETEAELAFSGLHDMLRPILDRLPALPEPQSAALAGALALGPPVSGDRLAVSAATLGLVTQAADERPRLIAVEDLQWVDVPSQEAMLFTGRRLREEGVGVILTVREGDPTAPDTTGLEDLRLHGLAEVEAAALLAERGHTVAPGVMRLLTEATGGNPLALLGAAETLSEAQLAGLEPLEGPLPVAEAIARAFDRHAERLTHEERTAVMVSAAAGDQATIATVVAALRRMDIPPAALEAAEVSGVLRLDGGRIEFAHPLARSAAYRWGAPADRRAAHRALAEVLDGGHRADRRAWHLAQAAFAPDEEVARALADAARTAGDRGGHAAAARAFARAAELSPDAEARAARLLAAARAADLAGLPAEAVRLTEEAGDATAEPLVRAHAEHLRGRVRTWAAPASRVHDDLVAAAERIAATEPALAALMLADAAMPHVRAGDAVVALETARRAVEMGRVAGPEAVQAEWSYAAALVVNGRAGEAAELVGRWATELERLESPLEDMRLAQGVPRVLIWLEEYEVAQRLLDRLVEDARARAPGLLPWALGSVAELRFRTGSWSAARAAAAEGAELGRDIGQPLGRAFCLATLARVEAGRGDEDACRSHAAEAREVGGLLGSEGPMLMLGKQALGLLALSLGDPEEALAHLRPLGEICRRRGLEEPGVVQYAPNLVEALARAGARPEAEAELERLESQAQRTGRAWAAAAAARCRGLFAEGDGYEEPLRRALAVAGDMPFERARTELALGERLRRDRRRAEARAHLVAALGAFEGLGAEPWAERARAELRATGEAARRRSEPRSDALTPQELQVAIMVSKGATNKEAGARLFLSAKTIEAHLGRIYRKLGVRSRTELASVIVREHTAPVA